MIGKRRVERAAGDDCRRRNWTIFSGLIAVAAASCAPTVKIEAPDKPIEINLNVKIDQEVRIKVDRELEQAIQQNPEIF